MSLAASTNSDVPLDAAGAIAIDVPCSRCSYNLRGKQLSDACSECGLSVREGTYGYRWKFIAHAAPGWVRKLFVGVALVFASLTAGIAWIVFAAIFDDEIGPVTDVLKFSDYVYIAFFAIGLIGLVLLTFPNPYRPSDRFWSFGARRCVRLFAAIYALVLTVAIVSATVMRDVTIRSPLDDPLIRLSHEANQIILFALIALPVALAIAICRHMRNIAKVSSAPRLARFAGAMFWIGGPIAVIYTGAAVYTFVQTSLLLARRVDPRTISHLRIQIEQSPAPVSLMACSFDDALVSVCVFAFETYTYFGIAAILSLWILLCLITIRLRIVLTQSRRRERLSLS